MKRFYRAENLRITFIVFAAIASTYLISVSVNILQPLSAAFSDFQLTDVYFSKLRDAQWVQGDTNIVLVNVGSLSRAGIARELDIINAHHPRVVGLDVFFRAPKTPELDSPLVHALAGTEHLVMVHELLQFNSDSARFDSSGGSMDVFVGKADQGFANLVIDNGNSFLTARSFSPRERLSDTTAYAFATCLARQFDSAAYVDLMRRNHPTEMINYRGNIGKFYALDVSDILNPKQDLSVISGKIVLMGYLGPTLGANSAEDIFFTPLNKKYVGKTLPDMYGVVVHANILSMILHRDYIGTMPLWFSILLALLLCHLHAVLYSWLDDRFEQWFDAVATAIQVTEAIGAWFLIIWVFERFHFQLDITLAIVAVVLCGSVFEVYHSLIHHVLHTMHHKYIRVWWNKIFHRVPSS